MSDEIQVGDVVECVDDSKCMQKPCLQLGHRYHVKSVDQRNELRVVENPNSWLVRRFRKVTPQPTPSTVTKEGAYDATRRAWENLEREALTVNQQALARAGSGVAERAAFIRDESVDARALARADAAERSACSLSSHAKMIEDFEKGITWQSRANRLADECGNLRAELSRVHAELGRVTMELDRERRRKR